MEKIIVLTGGSDQDENLIDCLKNLFPDCEIEIQVKEPAYAEFMEHDLTLTDDAVIDEKLSKYMSFL